ncbi:MAG TPA: hypothetical protein DCY27_05550, partial [Desulfobacterales bacterium]|nr:hypothetical protein [Desulfobacterales bacterium]
VGAKEDIQRARSAVKEMDDVLKVDETPEGPTMLYSGIPVEKVGESVKAATVKLLDNLGVAGEGVSVVQPAAARQPGFMTPFKSPTRVAKKYREVKPYVDDGIATQEKQERLRAIFYRRLKFIDKVLAAGKSRFRDPLLKTYKQNKTDLQEILLTGDMMGKKFSPEELRSAFGANEAVISAYRLTRAAYDHAHAIASTTRELRGKMPVGYREGYIPHFFHSWFIAVDGQLAGSARTLREALAMSNPVARAGAKIEIRPKQFEFPGGDVQAAVLGDKSYFKLKSNVTKSFTVTPSEAEDLLAGVARMKGRSRFVGNFLQRKGSQGWEKNLDWVNRHYFNMISRYAALDGFKASSVTRFEREFGAFDKEHKGAAKYIKDYINDINGNPTAVEDLPDNTITKVPGINQFFGKYLGNRPSLQLAGATTNAVAIAKLGLYNISSALINTTQLLNTNAILGAKWTAIGLKKAMLRSPAEKGILKQIGIDVQLGMESGAGYSKAAQMGRLFNTSTIMFQTTEKFMRRTAGLGSYYKALAEGKTRQQAIEYAKETIRRTQFEYGVADAPGFIRRSGPVGQVLFQFKKFPVKELEFITSLKGMENPRFWIPFALLSGYYALPGFESLNNTVKGLFDINIDLEAKKYLAQWAGGDPDKKAIARTIAYGIGSQAGIDISHRVGAGDFVPSEIKDLTGPAGSTAVRAAQMAAKGNWIETVRAISPAPGNLAQIAFLDGEITNPWDRERLKMRLTPQEKAVKATGFMPIRESVERDVKSIKGYAEGKRRDSETKAIDEFIEARERYGAAPAGEGKAQAQKELNEKVAKLKELKITPERVKEEQRKKKMTSIERAKENVPKKHRKEYERIDEFAK